jgi:hypothetical protein
LHRKNIPLMLYWTGNGPCSDQQAAAAFGFQTPVTRKYVETWATVAEEYSKRYGEKIVGWWCDGCYWKHGNMRYDDEKLGILTRALKSGNPKSIVALNPGVELTAYSHHEDFTAGEQNRFFEQPARRWLHGEQWHVLSFLGISRADNRLSAGWGEPGVGYGKQQLAEYISDANRSGGVVSIDVLLYRDGGLDRSQLEVLKSLRPALARSHSQAPVPPGNLAWHKPAQLLSLDGARSLQVNPRGGLGGDARFGVDGHENTAAQAAGEWPWTYEVDLLKTYKPRRVTVAFAPGNYATKLRIQVSVDRTNWHTMAELDNPDGRSCTATFAPTVARYVRVSAVRPDGSDQLGGQMAIAELGVLE